MARKAVPKVAAELETTAVGLQFRLKAQARGMLARHAPFPVKLYREPDNEDDPNAIRVHVAERLDVSAWSGMHIAYVPRKVAAVVSPKLDSGQAEIVRAEMGNFTRSDTSAPLTIYFRKG